MIEPQEALRIVLSNVRPLRIERTALSEALNCRLAEEVCSDRDQPPADRSAMDGYAVVAADLRTAPAELKLGGEVAAGSAARPRVRRGICAAIMTGGNLPPGADTVVPVEDTERNGNRIVFHVSSKVGANVRKRGEEARRGDVLLPKGTRLGPAQVGACATVGKKTIKVRRLPKVAVLSTGWEVRDVGERVAAHQLRDANGPALLAALAENGFHDTARDIKRDDPKTITQWLKRTLRHRDVVIITGGVSVGRYDHVPDAIRRAGATIRFHGVDMKPGRPQLYAVAAGNRHVFALPGNPVSTLTGYYELVLPALRRLCGTCDEDCRPAAHLPLAEPARSKGNRTYFHLARTVGGEQGLAVVPVTSAGSADIIAACGASGVIVIPKGVKELPAGRLVEYHAWQ